MAQPRFTDKVVLFSDIHNFSKIVAEMGSDYPIFIQQYYSAIGDDIVQAGGRIVKYMGDAILAVFARNAESKVVNCARKMRKRYAHLVEASAVTTRSELEIGINSGPVSFGTFGHPSLRTFRRIRTYRKRGCDDNALSWNRYHGKDVSKAAF